MTAFGGRATLRGHRGLGRDTVEGLVENTESILAAARSGLRWVEFDVRRTADALVVRHYPTLGDAQFLADLPLDPARALGAVTLAEVLDGLPEGIGVNFDLKTRWRTPCVPGPRPPLPCSARSPGPSADDDPSWSRPSTPRP